MFLSRPCLSFKFWMNYLGALCYLNNVNYKISLSLQYTLNIIFQFSGNTQDLRYLCWNSLSFAIAVSFFKPVMALCKLAWIIIMNLGFFCIVKINALCIYSLCLNIGVTALTCFSINMKFDSVYFYMVRVLLNACFDSAYFSVYFPPRTCSFIIFWYLEAFWCCKFWRFWFSATSKDGICREEWWVLSNFSYQFICYSQILEQFLHSSGCSGVSTTTTKSNCLWQMLTVDLRF